MFAWEYVYTWEMSSTNRLHLNKINYHSSLLPAVHLPTSPYVILGAGSLMPAHGWAQPAETDKIELSVILHTRNLMLPVLGTQVWNTPQWTFYPFPIVAISPLSFIDLHPYFCIHSRTLAYLLLDP